MTTPWGIVFHEYVLCIVHDDLVVVVRYHDLNGAFLRFGNRLRLDARLDLAIHKVLNEFGDVVVGELLALVKGELLVLDRFLDGESGPFISLQVEVAGVGAESLCVNSGKADDALVLLRQRFEDPS